MPKPKTITPLPERQPRPFMGRPKFVADSKTASQARRIGLQLEHLRRLLEETPYIELPVETWYEVSGSFLALNALMTPEQRSAAWQLVTDFRRGQRDEADLPPLATAFHLFECLKAPNHRRWMRETGGHAKRWVKIKSNPDALAKKRASSAASQRRRRAKLREDMQKFAAEQAAAGQIDEQPDPAEVLDFLLHDDEDKAAE